MRTLALAAAAFYLSLMAVTQVLLADISKASPKHDAPVAVASR